MSSDGKQVKQEDATDDSKGKQETSLPASGGAPSGVGNQEELDDSVLHSSDEAWRVYIVMCLTVNGSGVSILPSLPHKLSTSTSCICPSFIASLKRVR